MQSSTSSVALPQTLRKALVQELYLGVFTGVSTCLTSLTFSLSRRFTCITCENNQFKTAWAGQSMSPKLHLQLKRSFYNNVYLVAMAALECNFFHWDIRPANILFRQEDSTFLIIDWECGFDLDNDRDDSYGKLSRRASSRMTGLVGKYSTKLAVPAAFDLCSNFLTCFISKYPFYNTLDQISDAYLLL